MPLGMMWFIQLILFKHPLCATCADAFSCCPRGSQGKNTEGLPFPSPVDHILSALSTTTRLSWVAPQAWLGFIELDKIVVLVWLDWLDFRDYGFSVSALWCPLATATILLGFLLPWAWGISSRLLQQSTAAAPYLGWGVSPYRRIPDLQRGIAPLGPPVLYFW